MDSTTTAIVTKALPLSLAFIMFGLGLSLTPDDFRRIFRAPRPVLLGLAVQMVLLPAIALGLIWSFALPAPLAIGLMILAASPGGVSANIYSHLARGDVALNLTLTAINSVLAAVWLPLLVSVSLALFAEAGQTIGLQFGKSIEVFAVVLVPVVLGMAAAKRFPGFAKKADRGVRVFSFTFLILIVAVAVHREYASLAEYFAQIGLVTLAFNVLSLAMGFAIPKLARLSHSQSIAICMEIGIHNSTLAIYIALSVLNDAAMAMPAAIYSVSMFVTAGIAVALLKPRAEASTPTIAPGL